MVENIFSASGRKLAAFPERLRQWQNGIPVPPITVEVHPSEQCNHCCPDCQARYALSTRRASVLRKSGVFLNWAHLDTVWEIPPEGIVISGNTGDPLTHPTLEVLLNTLYARDIPTVLITNLQSLAPHIVDHVLRTCRGVRVSLDAWDETSFRRRHGRAASWNQVVSNLTYLLAQRGECGSKVKCLIGVGYLTDEAASVGMVSATRFARDLGVDYIQFRPYHFRATDISTELERCERYASDRFAVYASTQKYSRHNRAARTYSRCHGSHFFSTIDARGDVYMCCHHVGNQAAKYGSLVSSSWSDVISSWRRQDLLKMFGTQGCLPLCRLHAHNEWLENSGCYSKCTVELEGRVVEHACFL